MELHAPSSSSVSGDSPPLLAGVRVLECASVLAGPLAGSALAERGATVTKVERPPDGDVTRTWRSPGEPPGPASAYYAAANWGKQVVYVDLASPEGARWLDEVLPQTDVLLHNFKRGDLPKLGLDAAVLAERYPHLVQVALVGFEGDVGRLAYDVVVQAETGFMAMNGDPAGPPTRMPVALMDVLASHQIRSAVLEGLYARERGVRGYRATVSLERSGLSALVNQATQWLIGGSLPQRLGSQHPQIAPYGDLLPCADGALVLAVGNDRQFGALCNVLGLPDLPADPRFAHNADRVVHREALLAILSVPAARAPRAHWDAAFQAHGIPAGVIRTLDEVFAPGTPGARHLLRDPDGRARPAAVAYDVTTLPEAPEAPEAPADTADTAAPDLRPEA